MSSNASQSSIFEGLPGVHPSALISSLARLGEGVSVGAFSVIHDGVEIADGAAIGSHCVLGEPTAGYYTPAGQASIQRCVVGMGSIIRSHSVIYQGVTIGRGFESGHRVTIREGCVIGNGVRVGTLCDLQGDLTIGDYVRLHSSVFVAQGSTIENFAWVFPSAVLTNDPHPPSDTCTKGPTIKRSAVIAARAVLMPGVVVGENALVGAMSLVTRDVPDETVVLGIPAKPVGPTTAVKCKHGVLDHVYPWTDHFRRGYPPEAFDGDQFDA